MSNRYLTVKLDNTKISLADGLHIGYNMTNLPKKAFSFKTMQPLYWRLEQKQFDPISGILSVRVDDYNLPVDTILVEDELKAQIRHLNFEKLNWEKFQPLIYSYTLNQLRDSIFNYRDPLLGLTSGEGEDLKFLKRTAPNLFFEKREPEKHEKEIEIRVKYDEAKFDDSKICFSVNIKPYNLRKELEIVNLNLRPEFEYIKPFFIKRLGKSFLVNIKLKLADNQIEEFIAHSADIDSINESLVSSIKVTLVLNLRHLKVEREDKALYNIKELSKEAKELSHLNVTPEDILQILVENGKVKNVKQLEYLAKDRQNLNERILFTVKPHFGFVFSDLHLKQCFIWELLNSHATYVWICNANENNLNLGKIVEQAIAIIKSEGREVYKKYYKGIENPGYDFGIIEHSSNNLTDDKRFDEWKTKLERFCSYSE